MVNIKIPVNVAFPIELYKRLAKYANKRGVPVSVVVRDAVQIFLEQEEKK